MEQRVDGFIAGDQGYPLSTFLQTPFTRKKKHLPSLTSDRKKDYHFSHISLSSSLFPSVYCQFLFPVRWSVIQSVQFSYFFHELTYTAVQSFLSAKKFFEIR